MAGHNSHNNHNSYANSLANYDDPNLGEPKTLTWVNWAPAEDLQGQSIESSVDKIKELRNKIQYLQENHTEGSLLTPTPNPAIDLSGAADTELEPSDYVDDNTYDALRDSLETLTLHLKGSGTGLVVKNDDDYIEDTDFEQVKVKIDDLASYQAAYSNHNNHANHASYAN